MAENQTEVTAHESHMSHNDKVKLIWKTAAILGGITAIEFLVAFTLNNASIKITLFVLMTFVKAFYIVGEFMHLKYEVKSLIWSIVIPVIFIVWLVIALLVEGDSILNAMLGQ